MKHGFEALWNSALEDCGTESILSLKLRALALIANGADRRSSHLTEIRNR